MNIQQELVIPFDAANARTLLTCCGACFFGASKNYFGTRRNTQ